MLIDPSLYKTNKYVKVNDIRTYTYNEEIWPHNDNFCHTTHDTMALQYSNVNLNNQMIGSR